MIHTGLNRAEIAHRYYSKHFPEKKYSRNQCAKQFLQDGNIDKKKVKEIVDEIMAEQKQLLK